MPNSTTPTMLLYPGIDTLGTSLYNGDHVAIMGASVIIGVLGILGNTTVILVYWMNPKMNRSLTSLFIFHQSFIDLISSCVFLAIRLDTRRPLMSSAVADIACRLWYSEYLLWVIVMTSTLNLLLVSLERFVCISYSVYHRNHFSRKKAKVSMLIAWVISLAYQAYWAAVCTAVDGKCEPRWINEAVQTFFGIMTFFVEYLIPLTLMTFAYASIISRLNRRSRVAALYEVSAYVPGTAPKTDATDFEDATRRQQGPLQPTIPIPARMYMFSKAKRNVAKTLCFVFATYVICWTPTELEYLVYNLGGTMDFNGSVHRVTVILVLCNMCVNPIIYALKYRQFQRNLKEMFARCIDNLRRLIGKDAVTEQLDLYDLSSSPVQPEQYCHQAENMEMSE